MTSPIAWATLIVAVQLWTMRNYHYYLKQELFPLGPHFKRFRGFRWHPEQPLLLYVWNDGELERPQMTSANLAVTVQIRRFVWDVCRAQLPRPNDTASVAVVDGSEYYKFRRTGAHM